MESVVISLETISIIIIVVIGKGSHVSYFEAVDETQEKGSRHLGRCLIRNHALCLMKLGIEENKNNR